MEYCETVDEQLAIQLASMQLSVLCRAIGMPQGESIPLITTFESAFSRLTKIAKERLEADGRSVMFRIQEGMAVVTYDPRGPDLVYGAVLAEVIAEEKIHISGN